jgi:hypothetical protein
MYEWYATKGEPSLVSLILTLGNNNMADVWTYEVVATIAKIKIGFKITGFLEFVHGPVF